MMFHPPKTVETLQSPNQPLTLHFMENGNDAQLASSGLPLWTEVYVNGDLQDDADITLSNGDRLQLFVKASPAPLVRRAAYLSYGHKQFVLDVTTAQTSPPPPLPPAPPPLAERRHPCTRRRESPDTVHVGTSVQVVDVDSE